MLARLLAAALVLSVPCAAFAADSIGAAVGVTPAASGTTAGALDVGTAVYRNETIQTGDAGSAELRFLDETHLGVGPSSSVKLDKFVYVGKSSADAIVIKLTKGTFRFITGDAPKKAYRIETPLAVIGVRGTILEISILDNIVKVKLVEGAADVCPNGAVCVPLEKIGETFTILPDGTIKRGEGSRPFSIFCRLLDARESQICTKAAGGLEPLDVAPDAGGGGRDIVPGTPSTGPGTPTDQYRD